MLGTHPQDAGAQRAVAAEARVREPEGAVAVAERPRGPRQRMADMDTDIGLDGAARLDPQHLPDPPTSATVGLVEHPPLGEQVEERLADGDQGRAPLQWIVAGR